jgi:DNA-binding transcriptional LysR family regulator
MELRHLRYFVAVAEALSFTKAAEKLRLAQPSLTRQVRNLEEEIGVRLLNRANNRVVLTEEGSLFLSDARKVLSMCADSIAAVQQLNRGVNSRLNIGYIANLHPHLLPGALAAYRKLYPKVELNLFDMERSEQFQALESHKIDLGFVDVYQISSCQDMLSACVALEPIHVAFPVRHPLAKEPKIKLADLAPLFFVAMAPKTHPGARAWLIEIFKTDGFTVNILQEADNKAAAIQFVADGLGVALIPEQITKLSHEGVVFRPLSPPLFRESRVVWRADNLSKPLQDFVHIARDLSRGMQRPIQGAQASPDFGSIRGLNTSDSSPGPFASTVPL